ncbi:MAG: Hsp20/alpha crystallin family protein [Deltaproteobacteria bacterium]|nr:Hsp20/alpha crystallin family protein [Deltaproteobacteria bacterium]
MMTRMLQLRPVTGTMVPIMNIMDRILDEGMFSLLGRGEQSWIPAFDIAENEKEYLISAELPGLEEKDLDITISDGILTVKGEKKRENESNGDTYYWSERYYGSFERRLRIPEAVLSDKVEAAYKNGVLTLSMPKALEKQVRKIEISNN